MAGSPDDSDDAPGTDAPRRDLERVTPDDDLPVVARLVVEIRSDGRRTVARGGLEDPVSGQRVTIDARGDSPIALALALARSIVKMPRLAALRGVRGLLGGRKKDR